MLYCNPAGPCICDWWSKQCVNHKSYTVGYLSFTTAVHVIIMSKLIRIVNLTQHEWFCCWITIGIINKHLLEIYHIHTMEPMEIPIFRIRCSLWFRELWIQRRTTSLDWLSRSVALFECIFQTMCYIFYNLQWI